MDNWRFAVSCASNWNVTALAAGIKLDEPISFRDFYLSLASPKNPENIPMKS